MIHESARRNDIFSLRALCIAFNLTPRALRFYEEKGLIAAERNKIGWRIYRSEARQRLAWIVDLRAAGVRLPDISEVLDADEASGARVAVARQKLAARAQALAGAVAAVEAMSQRLSVPKASIAA